MGVLVVALALAPDNRRGEGAEDGQQGEAHPQPTGQPRGACLGSHPCSVALPILRPAIHNHVPRTLWSPWTQHRVRVAIFAAGAPSAASSVGGSAGPVPMSKTGTLVARLCPTLVELTPRAVPSSPRWVAIILPPVQHMQQGNSSGAISHMWDV